MDSEWLECFWAEDRMQGHITGALASIEEMAQIVTVPAKHWVFSERFKWLRKRCCEQFGPWNDLKVTWNVHRHGDYCYGEECCRFACEVSQEYSRHTSRFLCLVFHMLHMTARFDIIVATVKDQLSIDVTWRHCSQLRTVYILILPFALIELGHLMPVAVTVTAWALLSIEERTQLLNGCCTQPLNGVTVPETHLSNGGGVTFFPSCNRRLWLLDNSRWSNHRYLVRAPCQ